MHLFQAERHHLPTEWDGGVWGLRRSGSDGAGEETGATMTKTTWPVVRGEETRRDSSAAIDGGDSGVRREDHPQPVRTVTSFAYRITQAQLAQDARDERL